ncbi:MAG: helix-turn-helix transcriptional regulator [Deltaproteobacteria bacterium]|nr:helix-turn-helix transcriptional regulator [Deltaproteobacteria bacterium]
MRFELKTTGEMAQTLAKRLKNLRLLRKWKRSTLAERSGVSEASLRRFEQTARVSLENFLKLLSALDRLDEMDELLQPPPVKSIDDLEARKQKLSKRGSI